MQNILPGALLASSCPFCRTLLVSGKTIIGGVIQCSKCKNYSKVEAGKKGLSVDLFIQISEYLGVSLDYLIVGKVATTDSTMLKQNVDSLIWQLNSFKSSL